MIELPPRAWDVAIVPFPFVERRGTKRRPALAVSGESFNRHGHTVFAMITTKAAPDWPGDVVLSDLESAGLPRRCLVRLKLFTLDNRLILRFAGRLATEDRHQVISSLAGNLARI